MANRFAIRSRYMYAEIFYDFFVYAGLGVICYSALDREGHFVANEGEAVVIDRHIAMQLYKPGSEAYYAKWLNNMYRVPYNFD